MENINQTDSSIGDGNRIFSDTPVPTPNVAMPKPQDNGNLDKKREELLSMGKISDEVSGYLNKMSTVPERPPETKTVLKQSIVRTLKTDTEEAIKLEQMSSVSIALAEQKKKQKYPQVEQPADSPKSKKMLAIIISVFLIFAGIATFNFNYLKDKVSVSPETASVEIPSLITSDHNTELNLNELEKNKMIAPLLKIISRTETRPNSIENIFITKNVGLSEKGDGIKKPITSKEFLFLMSSKTPDILMRSLKSEYMIGVHSINGNHPFIILKTESYENSFAGMLVWEKTMARDLEPLLSSNIGMTQNATSAKPVIDYGKTFDDVLIKNKDARALRDSNGNTALIYSIPDKETILITDNAETLAELFNRIIRSRTIR